MSYTSRKTDPYGRKTRSPRPQIGIHVVLCMVIVVGTATAFVLYGKWREKTTSGSVTSAEAPEVATGTQWPDPNNKFSAERDDRPVKSQTVPDEEIWPAMQFQPFEEPSPTPQPVQTDPQPPEPRPIDPARRETFRQTVADARNSMAAHDLVAGRDHLGEAALCAQTDEEKARVDRLGKMIKYLEMFWDGIGQAVGGLKGGEEFVVADTVVIVVEAGSDYVVVRAQGMNRRYATREIPHVLVMALADRWFADVASSKVLVGTYLAVDPKGDRERTRQLWEEAAGEGLNVTSLMPELERSLVGGSGVLSDNSPDAPSTGRDTAEESQELVRRRFQSEYDRATSLPKKAALAKKLLATAKKAGDDLQVRLAMLREARDLAIASGEASVACDAIDVVAELQAADWQIGDVLLMKTEALSEVSGNAVGRTGQKEVAQQALKLFGEAVAIGRFDEARKLAPLAVDAAKKSKNPQLILQATAAAKRLAAIKKKRVAPVLEGR